ncbi:MAG: hypothetical protein KC435_14750 [Thermomicrobiales bacterium]|nr:hypothetical protein [Thermomicrobiales bacterium]
MLDSYRDLIEGLTEESTTLRELLGSPVPDDLPADASSLLKTARAREGAVLRRAQSVMRHENVNLRSIENEPDVLAAAELTDSPEVLLTAFEHDRGELVSLLINLTLKDWERKVPHYALGETTLAEEIEEHLSWEEDTLPTFEAALG